MLKTSKGEYALKFTYNALVEFEERTKAPFLEGLKKNSFSGIRDLVWAGLLHYQPIPGVSLTMQQVGDLIEDAINCGADLLSIHEEIMKAVDDALFINRLAEKSVERLAKSEAKNPSENKYKKWWQVLGMRASTAKESPK